MTQRWLYAWGLGSVAFGGGSLIVPLYLVSLGGGSVILGILAAVAAFVGVPGALLFGRLADRTGRRRGLVLSMLVLVAAVLAVIPFTTAIWLVIVLNGLLWFAFAAGTPVVTLLVVTDVPENQWSTAIGRLNKYQGIGWAVGLVLGAGWTGLIGVVISQDAVLTSFMFLLSVCGALGLLVGIRYLPPDNVPHSVPSGSRLRRALNRADRFSVRSATFPFTPTRVDFRDLRPSKFSDRFTPLLALYFLAVFVVFAGFAAFFAPLPVFLTDTGFSSDAIFVFYVINSLAAAVFFGAAGRLAAAYSVTRLQVIGLLGRAVALPAVALGGLLLGVSTVGSGVFAGLFVVIGLSWAVIAVTAGTLVTQLAPRVIRGEALGVYAALTAFAGGVGSILGGWLGAMSYLVAFAVAGGLVTGGALIVFEVGRRQAAGSALTSEGPL